MIIAYVFLFTSEKDFVPQAILLVRAALGRVYVETRWGVSSRGEKPVLLTYVDPPVLRRYTKWRGGRLKRMVSAKHVVREGKYDSVTGLNGIILSVVNRHTP